MGRNGVLLAAGDRSGAIRCVAYMPADNPSRVDQAIVSD